MIHMSAWSKAIRYLFTIIALVFPVSACQSQPVETPTDVPALNDVPSVVSSQSQTTITFACSSHDRSHYQQLADQFHEGHPSITVQILASDAVYGNNGDDVRKLATSVDAFILERRLRPQDFQSGLLRDLQPLIEADVEFSPADFYPSLLEALRWEGKTWGVPGQVHPLVLFYDKAAFDETGLSYPQQGWTIEEFEAAVRQLTRHEGEKTSRFGLVVSPWSLAGPILVMGYAQGWSENIKVLPEPVLDSNAVMEATQWFVDLVRIHGVMPNPYELTSGQIPFVAERVEEGTSAVWDGWLNASMLAHYEKIYDLGIVPFPGTPTSDWTGLSPYVMSAGTSHPDEAWEWLRFLTYQPGNVKDMAPPVRYSVADRTGYWARLRPDISPQIRYIMERPKVALPPGTVESIQSALKQIFTDNDDTEQVLQLAQKELAETLNLSPNSTPPPPISTPMQEQASIRYCSVVYAPALYQRLVSSFQELYPGIAIDAGIPEQSSEHSLKGFAEGCDCFEFFLQEQHEPEDQGVVLSLQPFVDADPDFPDDFFPGLLDMGRWEGELFALPAYVDFRVLRYNKGLFDQAGTAYPRPGWTTDDFWRTALNLTGGEGEHRIYGYAPQGPYSELFDLDFFVEQRGGFGEYDKAESLTGLAPLESSQAQAAVRWYTDLILTHGAIPTFPLEADFSQRRQLITAQRAAMWTEWQNWTTYPPPSFEIGTAPLPLDRGPMRQQNVVGYMISAQTTEPNVCWQWIRFLLDQPIAAARGSPVRQSLLEAPEFVSEIEEDDLATVRFNLEHMDTVAYRYSLPLHDAYRSIMDGTPVEVAVEEALSKDKAVRACLDAVPGQLRDEDITACLERAGLTSP